MIKLLTMDAIVADVEDGRVVGDKVCFLEGPVHPVLQSKDLGADGRLFWPV